MEGANVDMESNKYTETSAELMFSASDQIETLDLAPEKGKKAEMEETPNLVTFKPSRFNSQCVEIRGASSSHDIKVEHSIDTADKEFVTRAMLNEFLVKFEASQMKRFKQLEDRICHLIEEKRTYKMMYHKKVEKLKSENHKLRKRFRMYCDTVARMNNERDEAFERLLNIARTTKGRRLIRELSESSGSEAF